MDLFLIVILMFAGAVLGSLVGAETSSALPEVMVMTTAIGTVVGAVTAYGILAFYQCLANRSRRSTERFRPPAATSRHRTSFRKRIAQYAGKKEHDVLHNDDSFKSTMPFWAAVDTIHRFPPKSAAMIQQSLQKIRQATRS